MKELAQFAATALDCFGGEERTVAEQRLAEIAGSEVEDGSPDQRLCRIRHRNGSELPAVDAVADQPLETLDEFEEQRVDRLCFGRAIVRQRPPLEQAAQQQRCRRGMLGEAADHGITGARQSFGRGAGAVQRGQHPLADPVESPPEHLEVQGVLAREVMEQRRFAEADLARHLAHPHTAEAAASETSLRHIEDLLA